MMPRGGTFDYVAIVPEHADTSGFECPALTREPIATTGHDLHDARLVGLEPMLRVTDAGLTPDANAERPRVMRSRISLTAVTRSRATVAEASFHVDQTLTSCMRAGDSIHLARTSCAGIGMSVVRQGTLVVAVGAITAVTLGDGIEARIPMDVIDRATGVFRERDEDFEFPELPVEIRIFASRLLLLDGRRTVDDYSVFMVHGFERGLPGSDACAAIYRQAACPEAAAHASALLLDLPDAMSLSPW